MNVGELLSLTEKVLALPEGDDQVAAIEGYVDAFGGWFGENESLLSQAGRGGLDQQQLEKLAASHAEVMARVQSLLLGASDKMAALHRKARVIMAYTDILPKKISFSGTRKG